ncbi:EpsG family protein [Pseudoalteromonas phenolica]|uniref:EpsG family protein n=1 Tax=Pseudoalteromonas phenolica TaxID=161398 RepID=UPI00384DD3E8
MIVYFSLLTFVFLCSLAINQGRILNNIMFFLILVAMVLVPSLRDVSVGSDSFNYVLIFEKTHTLNDVFNQTMEPGYLAIAWLAKQFGENYIWLFAFTGFICVAGLVGGVKRYSLSPNWSFFFMIATGYYTFFFNGARQGLALAITFFAIGAFYEGKFKRLMFVVIIASFFHITALVLIPAYFLVRRDFSFKILAYIFVISAVSSLFLNELFSLAGSVDERFSKYVDYNKASGMLTALYNLAIASFFVFMYRFIKIHTQMYSVLLNLFLVGVSISVFAVFNGLGASGIARLSIYFTVSSILIWPIIFQSINSVKVKVVLLFAVLTFYLAYFYLTTSNFSNLVPYKVNPVIESLI